MKGQETKTTLGMHPVILLVCLVCMIGLSVSAAYLIMHAKYQGQVDNKDQQSLTVQKNNKALSDRNSELSNSLQKLQNEYGNLEAQYRDLASRLDSAEQKSMKTASELAGALKELKTAKTDASRLTNQLDAKLSEIEDLNADRQALQEKYNDFKEMLAPNLVLEPTWVNSGETALAFDGNLLIVLYQTSEKDKCQKDSVAVCYLIRGAEKKKLCLRTGKPEDFTYQYKTYLLNLLESKESEGVHRYCIYIMKQQ